MRDEHDNIMLSCSSMTGRSVSYRKSSMVGEQTGMQLGLCERRHNMPL